MFWPAATIQGAGSLRDCKCKRRSWSAIGSMPRVFLDGLGVGISLIDAPTGHIRFANKEYCRILGYSEQELTRGSVSFLELTHPDDRERSDAEHRRLLNGEIPQYRLDKRCLRGDGNLVWVHVTVNAIRGSKGEVRWCSVAVEDIGTTKILEQQLAAAQRVAGLATWNFAVKTNSSETSPSFNALFGVSTSAPAPSLDELIGRVHPDTTGRTSEPPSGGPWPGEPATRMNIGSCGKAEKSGGSAK